MRTVRRIAEENVFLVLFLGLLGVLLLTVFPPYLLVNDSWLTLVAGREIVEHGLPHTDQLTILGLGRTWTDQQWGAQLVAYGAYSLGGHALLTTVVAVLVAGGFALAIAAARSLGAGSRAIVLVFFPVIIASPWFWTIRAQVFAIPLYAGLLWLLLSEARRPSARVYVAFPLLVVWANVHGSAALGALLVMLLGAVELVTSRGRSWRRSTLLVALPPLAVLASPYGPIAAARYYWLMLVDPPFGNKVTEWQRSTPGWDTLVFYVLAAVALAVVVLRRKRLTLFDVATLALTFAGAVSAIRGIPWFGLACMIILPVAIGQALEGRHAAPVRRRLNRAISVGVVAVLVLAVAFAFARRPSWYQSGWPNAAIPKVRKAVAQPGTRVFATDRYSDWLLWKLPSLRGRLAYDVRFEIYQPSLFDRLARYYRRKGQDWKQVVDGYRIVVVDERAGKPRTKVFLDEPGSRVLYGGKDITVVIRKRETA